jgi:hypothetical protein
LSVGGEIPVVARISLRSIPGYLLEAETWRGYIRSMAETFKCPHCGALYEIVAHERTVSDDRDVADCQVCGRRMDATNGSRILRYELVRMPDGTNV